MRDRLIKILSAFPVWGKTLKDQWFDKAIERLADHLLASGVIVPPCKVGQIVWFIRNKKEIIATCIEKIILKHGGLYIKLCCNSMYETTCNSVGKTVFLTKEEAEKALAERSGE